MTITISAKQINSVRNRGGGVGCPRQFVGGWVDRAPVPAPKSKALEDGIELHRAMAHYLRTGDLDVPPESHFGRMVRALWAAAGIEERGHWYAEPEHRPACPIWGDDIKLYDKPDAVTRATAPTPRWVDWKSTSHERWAIQDPKTEAQYWVSTWGMLVSQDKAWGVGDFVYVNKNTYESWVVSATATIDECEDWLRANRWVAEYIRTCYVARGELTLLHLPPNPEHCQGTGHFCDHYGRCASGVSFDTSKQIVTLEQLRNRYGIA
jgi:hypothetical protein